MTANSLPVLITGYSRVDSLIGLVEAAIKSDVQNIYVALDGSLSEETTLKQSQIIGSLKSISSKSNAAIKIFQREENLGSGAGIVNALNWFFSEERAGIILEDDLVVEENFFTYMNQAISLLESEPDILMASGTRLRNDRSQTSTLCSYPVVWGWATTRKKWQTMSGLIFQEGTSYLSHIALSEKIFWVTGKRRALRSQIDAWDIPLSAGMRAEGYFSLVPPINLVSNIGFDEVASHTTIPKWPLQLKLDSQLPSQILINRSSAELIATDELMRSKVFGISIKNVFTGVASIVIDPIRFYGRRNKPKLIERANWKSGDTL
jgi:hypothetical protein